MHLAGHARDVHVGHLPGALAHQDKRRPRDRSDGLASSSTEVVSASCMPYGGTSEKLENAGSAECMDRRAAKSLDLPASR